MNNRRTRKAILAKVKRAREVADFDRLFGIKKEELTTNKSEKNGEVQM